MHKVCLLLLPSSTLGKWPVFSDVEKRMRSAHASRFVNAVRRVSFGCERHEAAVMICIYSVSVYKSFCLCRGNCAPMEAFL